MSADRLVINRTESEWPAGGEYRGPMRGANGTSALMRCPECRGVFSLSDHTISDDGVVDPSVVCPGDGCSWHVWVRLEGWDAA